MLNLHIALPFTLDRDHTPSTEHVLGEVALSYELEVLAVV